MRIECDIITGSYINGKPTHTLYEFFPSVPPGYTKNQVVGNIKVYVQSEMSFTYKSGLKIIIIIKMMYTKYK